MTDTNLKQQYQALITGYRQFFEKTVSTIDSSVSSATGELLVDGMMPLLDYTAMHVNMLAPSLLDIIADNLPDGVSDDIVEQVLENYAQFTPLQRQSANPTIFTAEIIFKEEKPLILPFSFRVQGVKAVYRVEKAIAALPPKLVSQYASNFQDFVTCVTTRGEFAAYIKFVSVDSGEYTIPFLGESLQILTQQNGITIRSVKVVEIHQYGSDEETNQQFAKRLLRYFHVPSLMSSQPALQNFIETFVGPSIRSLGIPAGHKYLHPQAATALFPLRNRIDIYVSSGNPVEDVIAVEAKVHDASQRLAKIHLPREFTSGVYDLQISTTAEATSSVASGAVTIENSLWEHVSEFGWYSIPAYMTPIIGSHVSTCVVTIKDNRRDSANQYIVPMVNGQTITNVYVIKRLRQPAVEFTAQKLFTNPKLLPVYADFLVFPAKPCYVQLQIGLRSVYDETQLKQLFIHGLQKIPLGTSTLTRTMVEEILVYQCRISPGHIASFSFTGTIVTGFKSSLVPIVDQFKIQIPVRDELRVSPETTFFTSTPDHITISIVST